MVSLVACAFRLWSQNCIIKHTIANQDDLAMMPGLEQLFVQADSRDVLPWRVIDQSPDRWSIRCLEVSDFFNHFFYRISLPASACLLVLALHVCVVRGLKLFLDTPTDPTIGNCQRTPLFCG